MSKNLEEIEDIMYLILQNLKNERWRLSISMSVLRYKVAFYKSKNTLKYLFKVIIFTYYFHLNKLYAFLRWIYYQF